MPGIFAVYRGEKGSGVPKRERCSADAETMFAALPQNDVVSCGHKHKKEHRYCDALFLVTRTGIEPMFSP